jgi:hypothetical protein
MQVAPRAPSEQAPGQPDMEQQGQKSRPHRATPAQPVGARSKRPSRPLAEPAYLRLIRCSRCHVRDAKIPEGVNYWGDFVSQQMRTSNATPPLYSFWPTSNHHDAHRD